MDDPYAVSETHTAVPYAGRVLGLDVGSRRIGVAISGPLGMPAQPLLTLGNSNPRQTLKDLQRLIRKHGITAIVTGNPLHLSGEPSPQAAEVQAFVATLRDTVPLPVHLQDERLSSAAADELMDRLGLPRGPERKMRLDQYAAVIILQDWLDAEERQATERSANDAPGPLYSPVSLGRPSGPKRIVSPRNGHLNTHAGHY